MNVKMSEKPNKPNQKKKKKKENFISPQFTAIRISTFEGLYEERKFHPIPLFNSSIFSP